MSDDIEPVGGDRAPLPFEDLAAPEPLAADPPKAARLAAFGSILLGGLLGGLVGYGVGDVMFRNDTWAAVGALVGAITGAVGVGVVANLTLRAMNEWNAVQHPEDQRSSRRDRQWSRRGGDQKPSRPSGDQKPSRRSGDQKPSRPSGRPTGRTDGSTDPGADR